MKRRGFLTSLAGLFGAVTCGKFAKAITTDQRIIDAFDKSYESWTSKGWVEPKRIGRILPYGPFLIATPPDIQTVDINGALRMTDGKKEWEVTVRELSKPWTVKHNGDECNERCREKYFHNMNGDFELDGHKEIRKKWL